MKCGFCEPVGVGELLIAGLFCSPLVAGKVSTAAPCVGERIPVVLKQKGQGDAPRGAGPPGKHAHCRRNRHQPRGGGDTATLCAAPEKGDGAAAADSSTEVAQKVKTERPQDPAIPLLVYTRELRAGSPRDICTRVFTAASFTTAKRRKRTMCPLTRDG